MPAQAHFQTALAVEVSGVSARCTGKWTAQLSDQLGVNRAGRGHGDLGWSAWGAPRADAASGSVGVTVAGSKLSATIAVLEHSSLIDIEKCDTTLDIASVEWHGAASKLLDWLSKEAEQPLADALQAIGCLEVRTAGKKLLDEYLADFNTQVVPYLRPSPAPMRASAGRSDMAKADGVTGPSGGWLEQVATGSGASKHDGRGMIDWRRSGWLQLADWALNDYLGLSKINTFTAASHGRAELLPADGPPCPSAASSSSSSSSSFLTSRAESEVEKQEQDAAIAEETRCLQLPSSLPPLTLTVENITLGMALKGATFDGLDGVNEWHWLEPTVDNGLRTSLGGKCLNATLHLGVMLQLKNSSMVRAPPLSLPLTVTASLLQPRLTFGILLDVFENKSSALNLADDTEIGCLLRTVASAGLSELRFDYGDASLALGDGNSTDLLPQIKNFSYGVLELIATIHKTDVEAVLSALIAGPAREALNGLLTTGLNKVKTTPATAAQGGSGLLSLSCDAFPQPLAPDVAPPMPSAVVWVAMPAVSFFAVACVGIHFCLCARTKKRTQVSSPVRIRRGSGVYHGGPFMEQRRAHQALDNLQQARATLQLMADSPRVAGELHTQVSDPSPQVSPAPQHTDAPSANLPPLGEGQPWWLHVAFAFALGSAAILRVWTIAAPLARIGLTLSVDDTVSTDLTSAGVNSTSLIDGTLQRFSCTQMVQDFWAAGATVLTCLILCGSVIFPFFKQLLMLIAWTLPWSPRIPFTRRLWLHALHILGRSAFAAEVFLGYIVCLFYIRIDQGQLHVLVVGEPLLPIYGGLASTALLSVLSHWMLLAAEPSTPRPLDELLRLSLSSGAGVAGEDVRLRGSASSLVTDSRSRADSAASDAFSQMILGEGVDDNDWVRQGSLQGTRSSEDALASALAQRRRIILLSVASWLLSIVTYTYALTGPLVSFTTTGLVGDATVTFKQQGVGEDLQSYSLLGLPLGFPGKTDAGGAKYIISAVLISCTFAAPLLFLFFSGIFLQLEITSTATEAVSRAVPKAARSRYGLVSEHVYGWVGTEVLWLAALASAREMDLVAQWVFGQHFKQTCANLETTLGLQCVKITGKVEERCWVLLVSAVAMGALRLALEVSRTVSAKR